MAIIFDRDARLLTIHTRNTSYQMKVDELGYLLHTYYGDRIDAADMSYQFCDVERGFSGNAYDLPAEKRFYSLDVLPQEYSCFGTQDFRAAALRVQNSDGSQGAELRFLRAETENGKYSLPGLPSVHGAEGETLLVYMQDPVTGLEVCLQYGVLEALDVITRSVRITNKGTAPLRLEKAASLTLDWQFENFDWITFYGGHMMERQAERRPLSHGCQSIGSVRGTSSHHYNPFSILCAGDATEDSGSCYGFSFVYSGEFLMEAEKDQADQTRFVCGIHPDNFSWELSPGDSFQTPEVILAYSGTGLGTLSRIFHKTIREHIFREPWKNQRRPILINNWEATYFDFTGDELVSIAEEAAKLNIELFVLDDGWFGKRDDDYSGLGDWFANEKKLGCSLGELANRITNTGMKFGLWFEPEAISEDSDLYRKHPDWAIRQPGRKPVLARNQLVLDFSRRDVQDYIIERMSSIIRETSLIYIKWDMNRSISDKYAPSLGREHQGEFSHRYVLGLYRVLETLHQEFPEVLIEGCSGGGGRFDAGMLYYTPQIWCSDNSDAIARLNIQYGTSFGYPVSAVGAHVSAVPNHQTGRVTPFSTRGTVAMSGTFGYELDITKLSDEEKEEVKRQIAFFKEHYELIQNGAYYRLTTPKERCVVWEFADADGKKALVNAVYHDVQANPSPSHVRLYGLDERKNYHVVLVDDDPLHETCCKSWRERNRLISGKALLHGGLTLPRAFREFQAFQILLEAVET